MKNKTRNLLFVIIGLIIIAIVFIFCLNLYVTTKNQSLEYRDIAAIFTAIIVCGTLIVNVINTQANAELNLAKIEIDKEKLKFDKEKFLNDKKILSHNFADGYNSPFMRSCLETYLEYKNTHKQLEKWEFAVKIAEEIKPRLAVGYMLNFLEKVAIAYREGVCDRGLVKEFFFDIFKLQYELHSDYIRYI
jgi:hypothetical protein